MSTPAPDLHFVNHGSLILIAPLTDEAKAWVTEHVAVESWAWMGPAFACEPRYAGDLLAGAEADGLIVSW